jgi:alkylhydroperoxidase family enzyme
LQGGADPVIDALSQGALESAPLEPADRALLEFVGLLTLHAYRNTPEDVQRVRDAGWTDEQIAECVYIASLFAFFNRVADAFGLQDPGYRQMAAEEQPQYPTVPPLS